jgi:DNA adenine methylase
MNEKINAKPFMKWAGGKTQLLDKLESHLPDKFRQSGKIDCYIEPFVGGGAFFFYLKSRYCIKKAYLIDNNHDLILTYKVIQSNPTDLIEVLSSLQNKYLKCDDSARSGFYYKIREQYNYQRNNINYCEFSAEWTNRASFVIFLNKTCFNGLFRQNSSGAFNVPHGRYKNPKICDYQNIIDVSNALKGVQILNADFSECKKYAKSGSLVYFDPPYRPLNATSSFTSYTKAGFCDDEQIRLADLCQDLSKEGVSVLLSNSDPTNENKYDRFFEDIYNGFNIENVLASRMINCNGARRGQIRELLITNCNKVETT